MEIDLRHLRLIRALGDTGSVSQAAATLGATQPAFSRQLHRIERSLGARLFVRSREGVAPTSLGRLVLARARAILPAVEALQNDAASLVTAGEPPSQLALGSHLGSSMIGLIDAVEEIAPDAQVIAESESRVEGLVDMVTAGRLDAASVSEFVGFEITLPPDLDRLPIATTPVFVALSADHPLAGKEEIALRDLADERWVLSPIDLDREADVFASACEKAGFEPRIKHYLAGSAAAEFIRRGGYVGLAYPTARLTGLVTRPIEGDPIRSRHLLLTSRQSFLAQHAETLARRLRGELDTAAHEVPSYAEWLQRRAGR